MKFPWVSRKQAEADWDRAMGEIRDLTADLQKAHSELNAMRHDERSQTQEFYRLNERLANSASLCADKQREIAMLRTLIQEKDALHAAERAEARADRARLMDWVAKGVTGVPIFAEVPKQEPEAPEAPAKPGTERVPTDVEDAISKVGRKARAVVNHITKKKDVDFQAAMAGAGVRRILQEDKLDAEVEATVIHEQQHA